MLGTRDARANSAISETGNMGKGCWSSGSGGVKELKIICAYPLQASKDSIKYNAGRPGRDAAVQQ